MTTLVFDIETNGLMDKLDRVHCLCINDITHNSRYSFGPDDIHYGVNMLMTADVLIGHNILGFDIPAIKKVYPWLQLKPSCKLIDTLLTARLIYPEIAKSDMGLAAKGKLPRNLIGRYSLQAFGYRLEEHKGDYKGGWEAWSREMQDYCEQDIEVTTKLYLRLMETKEKQGVSDYCVELEHDVAAIILRQEQNGIGFDEEKAQVLHQELIVKRMELEKALLHTFPPWEVKTPFTPKVNSKKYGYTKGVMTYKVQVVEFNPGSRQHIAKVLHDKYGWKPAEFTDTGEPKVDDTVLSKLQYPEARLLAEYFMIQKRLGQLAEGGEGLLKHVKKGRIHGRVSTCGAVTGRMTHSKPNIAQVPSNRAPYGERFRELFVPRVGWIMVGCDADALELRCLAHYMAAYDGGEYTEVVLKGDKSNGTDMHSINCRAIGLDPQMKYPVDGTMIGGRDIAKTWFYAFIYGAGDHKLGLILGAQGSDEAVRKAGAKSRKKLLTTLTALGTITEKVKEKVQANGCLKGIDGRRLSCRSSHSAFNTLLQSAGAIAMKVALVILDRDLKAAGLTPGADYEFVANVHDEWQLEARPEVAELVGKAAALSIEKAGDELNFKCPLSGNYNTGRSWKETH